MGHHHLDIRHRNGVDARKGFVQQDEARVRGQGPGDLHPPPFASGQGTALAFPDVADVEFLDQVFHLLPAFVLVRFDFFQDGHDVLFHRKFPEDGGFLGQIANALQGPFVHGKIGNVLVIQVHMAGIRMFQSYDHVEGSGLPGTVGPQKSHNGPLFHFQADFVDHPPPGVFFYQFFRTYLHS